MKRTTRMLYLEEISDIDDKDGKDEKRETDIEKQANDSSKMCTNKGKESFKTKNKVFPLPDETVTKDISSRLKDVTESYKKPYNDFTERMPAAFQKARKAFMHHDELKSIQDTLLYKTLKELFICMKITGIFFLPKPQSSHNTGCRGFWINCTSLQVYCGAMCIMLFLNFVRSLVAFEDNNPFGPVLFFKFLTTLFFYESMSRAMLGFWSCWRKKNGLQELFLSLEQICYPDKIIPYESSLRHTMQIFLVLTFVISFANAGMTAYGMFGPPEVRSLFDLYLVPVPPESPGILGFKIFLLLLTFVNGMVAILSLTFYVIICYILYKEFEYFCRMMEMKIRPDGVFSEDLEKLRTRHLKRCKLVENSDQILKYYIANTYLTNVPLLCLLLYSIVYSEGGGLAYRLISSFRLFYVLLQMLVLSVAATIINSQAHAPLSHLYNLRTFNVTCERQSEMGMFLNKLTGTSIGLTAWDMFVINKPTSLTVIGMILTYFFLLVQFKNPLEPAIKCYCYFDNGNVNISLLAI